MTRALHWFRRDLSVVDNLAWAAATHGHDEVVPVFVVDRRVLDAAGPFRRAALTGCLAGLHDELQSMGGGLTVVTGDPVEVVPRLAARLGVSTVLWNDDVTGFAQRRDRAVRAALAGVHVPVDSAWSTIVQPPRSVLTDRGAVPRVFGAFHRRWAALPLPARLRPGPAEVVAVPGEPWPVAEGVRPRVPLGPAAARDRLAAFVGRAAAYGDARSRVDLDATSRLSVDLRFGSISPRELRRAVDAEPDGGAAFARQLAWRDWYAHLFHERPELVERSQQPAFDRIEWRNDPAEVEAWRAGRTGYPVVDAAMRELAATGWIHNRLRMIAASFLVKDLLVDWRIGERHFRQLLVDGDVPQNAGNWQWTAGTGPDAAPYFRILNPVTQARKVDPEGDHVRTWVPELAGLPGPAVHAPWELGPLELAAAGVVLGDTYPEPIVDHGVAREHALAAYAAARGRD